MAISRRIPLACAVLATLIGRSGIDLCAASQDAAVIRMQATVRPRVSLQVSDQILRLAPSASGDPAARVVGTIAFTAAARTSGSGEVLLTVEPASDATGWGGPDDGGAAIQFSGAGTGTFDGVLAMSEPALLGRWTGPGVRHGQVTFTVTGAVGPNGAVVPLRFVLSTP